MEIETHNPEKKLISILFSTYTDFTSKIISLFSGFGCTHVSISLDNEDEYFYSFNKKGFRKEYPRKHKSRLKQDTCFRVEITEEQYEQLKSSILEFERRKELYNYNLIGLIFCMLRLSKKRRDKYFCSEFIAEVLSDANIIKLERKKSRYLPIHLEKQLALLPAVVQVSNNIFEGK